MGSIPALGITDLNGRIGRVELRVEPLIGALQVLIANESGRWTPEQRMAVQQHIAHFGAVGGGLVKARPSGNPVSEDELRRLRAYVDQASRGESFTADQARDFQDLADRVSSEHAREDWAAELLKIAMFTYAVYVLADALKPKTV